VGKNYARKKGQAYIVSIAQSLAFRIRIRLTNLVLDFRNLAVPRDRAQGSASNLNARPGQMYCVCLRNFRTEVNVNISKAHVFFPPTN
jgi:hypothetical protein